MLSLSLSLNVGIWYIEIGYTISHIIYPSAFVSNSTFFNVQWWHNLWDIIWFLFMCLLRNWCVNQCCQTFKFPWGGKIKVKRGSKRLGEAILKFYPRKQFWSIFTSSPRWSFWRSQKILSKKVLTWSILKNVKRGGKI